MLFNVSGEFNIAGVYAPSLLLWALIALGLAWPLRRIFERTQLYRYVWHRGLFDLALLVLLWGAVSTLGTAIALPP
jgi:hypothetical protein